MSIKLKGDSDGFAGRYEAEGRAWTVAKFYVGKGIGARWTVNGPFFSEGRFYGWSDIKAIVDNWTANGAVKTA